MPKSGSSAPKSALKDLHLVKCAGQTILLHSLNCFEFRTLHLSSPPVTSHNSPINHDGQHYSILSSGLAHRYSPPLPHAMMEWVHCFVPVHCCGKESPREKVVPYSLLRQQECCFDMLVCIEQTTNCFQLLLSAPLFVPKPISSLCSEIGGQGSHGVCTGRALLVSPLHVYTCAGRQKSAVVILTTTNILSTRGA